MPLSQQQEDFSEQQDVFSEEQDDFSEEQDGFSKLTTKKSGLPNGFPLYHFYQIIKSIKFNLTYSFCIAHLLQIKRL